MEDSNCDNLTQSLISDVISILSLYMNRIENLHPHAETPQSIAQTSGDDSQGSLGISVNVDRQMMIFVSLRDISSIRLC